MLHAVEESSCSRHHRPARVSACRMHHGITRELPMATSDCGPLASPWPNRTLPWSTTAGAEPGPWEQIVSWTFIHLFIDL